MPDATEAVALTHVEAIVRGKSYTFRLEPGAHWAEIHRVWFGPLLALHQRILIGEWRQDEILRVLAVACVGALGRAWAMAPDLEDALSSQPVATYAPLAARILEAHLFGLDPALTRWTEADAFGAASA
ncbi:gene transfer agent family protein [Methylobacterium sp. W2]|uniref:GTA-gp10 family protein n=1 Tax=Methylobacterium sp. W2 TaxID=2598107 RepID=UPI001D0CC31A|nr:GTA-gp10 family protein [Methylobacterium sp. W2]MCC0806506.1 gene transfer agent family protein [Methylobacterium sp. W2]